MWERPRVGVFRPRWLGTVYPAAAVLLAVAVPLVIGASSGAPGVFIAAAQPSSADGAFTTDQAASGWSVYGVQCEECHGLALGHTRAVSGETER